MRLGKGTPLSVACVDVYDSAYKFNLSAMAAVQPATGAAAVPASAVVAASSLIVEGYRDGDCTDFIASATCVVAGLPPPPPPRHVCEYRPPMGVVIHVDVAGGACVDIYGPAYEFLTQAEVSSAHGEARVPVSALLGTTTLTVEVYRDAACTNYVSAFTCTVA